ncbi:TetR/AcrR family transcriptional regulator [Bacillus pumilus]
MLNGGEELFCRKGYEETRIMDIVKGVGIGKGSFYYYF